MRILFCLSFLACSFSFAEKINIWGGNPNGGFGDVATNLLLAQQLVENRPDAEITVIYSDEVGGEYLPTLIPGFTSKVKEQTFGGIRFVSEHGPIPQADYFLEFSAKRPDPANDVPELPAAAIASGKARLRFSELGTNSHINADHQDNSASQPVIVNESTGSQPAFRFLTGTRDNEAGLYINSRKSSPTVSRKDLLADLAKRAKYSTPIPENAVIAFAYSYNELSAHEYHQALDVLVKNKAFGGRPIVLVSNHPPERKRGWSSDVTYLDIPNLPFGLSKEILHHIDVPALVTGSVSLSLAVDAEAPFLYEKGSWKANLAAGLVERLTAGVSGDDAAKHRTAMNSIQAERGEGVRPKIGTLVELLRDREFYSGFRSRLHDLRKHQSLVQNLSRFLDVYPALSASPEKLTNAQWEVAFQAAKNGRSVAEVKQEVLRTPTAARKGAPTTSFVEKVVSREDAARLVELSVEEAVQEIIKMGGVERKTILEKLQDHTGPHAGKIRSIHRALFQSKDAGLLKQLRSFGYCRIHFGDLM